MAALSIISRPPGMMPRLMIAPTAVPASSTASKAASITRAHSGRGSSFTRTLHDDPEQTFRAGHQREQVEAGSVEGGGRRW